MSFLIMTESMQSWQLILLRPYTLELTGLINGKVSDNLLPWLSPQNIHNNCLAEMSRCLNKENQDNYQIQRFLVWRHAMVTDGEFFKQIIVKHVNGLLPGAAAQQLPRMPLFSLGELMGSESEGWGRLAPAAKAANSTTDNTWQHITCCSPIQYQ